MGRGQEAPAHEWLMRASVADRDPAWVCEHCGNPVAEWSALCGKCMGFDSFTWRTCRPASSAWPPASPRHPPRRLFRRRRRKPSEGTHRARRSCASRIKLRASQSRTKTATKLKLSSAIRS